MYIVDYAKPTLMFLVLMVSMSFNIDDNLIARLGISSGYGSAILVATVMTVLLSGRDLVLISLTVLFSINANMPMEFVLNFGIDRDFYGGLMVSLVLIPFLAWFIE